MSFHVVGLSLIVIAAQHICKAREKYRKNLLAHLTPFEYAQLVTACQALQVFLDMRPFSS